MLVEGSTPPDNTIAVSVSVEGVQPFAAMIPANNYTEVLKSVEAAFGLNRSKRFDKGSHIDLREKLYMGLRSGSVADAGSGFAQACLWLAMNHYTSGDQVRRQVSDLIRQDGRAVINVFITGNEREMRWGFSVSEVLSDMTDLLLVAPNEPIVLGAPLKTDEKFN